MVFNGHTINRGASTLVYNGLIQMFSRFVVGPLAASDVISVIRMSEFAKFSFMVFTILSNIFTSYNFHSVYMIIVGLGGGMLSSCDFILVKDCMGEGRELGEFAKECSFHKKLLKFKFQIVFFKKNFQ